MIPHPPSTTRPRRAVAALVALVLAAAAGGAATAGADPGGATVSLSTTALPASGGTIAVTGSGYDPAGSVGTRPPFAGQPAGVYVVFGRFADTWQPSVGAPGTARQVIRQVWALPRAQHDLLDPTGANPDVVLLQPDGTFTVELAAVPAAGTGTYGVATYPGSGAVNPAYERFVPVALADVGTTTSTTTTTTSTTTTTAAPPTTAAPTTTTAAPTTTTTVPPAPPGGTVLSAGGQRGQTLTVRPGTELDRSGATVAVTGTGYDPDVGVYVALCVDQGPTAPPSPCLGGVALEGSTGTSAWVSSDPPPFASGLATPFGPGGTFSVQLRVAASDRFVDCLAEGVRCVLATRADHTAASDRSADVKVPVRFAGQDTVTEAPDDTVTVAVEPGTVPAGGTVTVRAAGLAAGEQAQVRLAATGAVLAAGTADAAGGLVVDVTVPATTATGVHRLTVTGVSSGRSASSGDLAVTEPATPAAAPVVANVGGATASRSAAAPSAAAAVPRGASAAPSRLAATGSDAGPAALGALLLLAGVALSLAARRAGHTPGGAR